MRAATLKKIDCWVGIPFCFTLSIINTINHIFISKNPSEYHPRKIIFLELSEIGSVILGYPAMKKARELHSDCKFYLWIFKKNKDVSSLLGLFPEENVIAMREDNFICLGIDLIRNLWRVRKEKIDVIIDMELFSRFTSLLGYFGGAKIRIGFYAFSPKSPYRGNLHTHKVRYSPYRHISSNFLALVEPLKMFSKERFLQEATLCGEVALPKKKASSDAQNSIWGKLRAYNNQITHDSKIIILHPGINDAIPLRTWPIYNYVELARRLLINPEIVIIVIGAKPKSSDYKIFEQRMLHPRCIHFIGKTAIKELVDLFTISHLLISHDSGAAHLASLAEINTIVLFGPETPSLYRPLSNESSIIYKNFSCSPCLSAYNYRSSCCKDNKCLQIITVDEVYNQAVKSIGLFGL